MFQAKNRILIMLRMRGCYIHQLYFRICYKFLVRTVCAFNAKPLSKILRFLQTSRRRTVKLHSGHPVHRICQSCRNHSGSQYPYLKRFHPFSSCFTIVILSFSITQQHCVYNHSFPFSQACGQCNKRICYFRLAARCIEGFTFHTL